MIKIVLDSYADGLFSVKKHGSMAVKKCIVLKSQFHRKGEAFSAIARNCIVKCKHFDSNLSGWVEYLKN